jgi:predicted RNase H-like nuclease (RuvC/YqgF family)
LRFQQEIDLKDKTIAALEQKVKLFDEIKENQISSNKNIQKLEKEIFELKNQRRETRLNRLNFYTYLEKMLRAVHTKLMFNVDQLPEATEDSSSYESTRLQQIEAYIIKIYLLFK